MSELVCFYCKKVTGEDPCSSCRGFLKKRDDLQLQVKSLGLVGAAAQNGMTVQAVSEVLSRPTAR